MCAREHALSAEEPGTGHNPHPYNCTAVLNFELNQPSIPHIFPTNSTPNQGVDFEFFFASFSSFFFALCCSDKFTTVLPVQAI